MMHGSRPRLDQVDKLLCHFWVNVVPPPLKGHMYGAKHNITAPHFFFFSSYGGESLVRTLFEVNSGSYGMARLSGWK